MLLILCLYLGTRDCAKLLVSFHKKAAENSLKTIYRKYSNPQRGAVALFPPAKALLASTTTPTTIWSSKEEICDLLHRIWNRFDHWFCDDPSSLVVGGFSVVSCFGVLEECPGFCFRLQLWRSFLLFFFYVVGTWVSSSLQKTQVPYLFNSFGTVQ